MNEKELREFRARFDIPLTDDVIADTPFYRPPADSPEMKYLLEQREKLGGFVPARIVKPVTLTCRSWIISPNCQRRRAKSTTMAFGRLLSLMLQHKGLKKHLVPIIPDEARTFGLDTLFREIGIYSPKGQLYEPVDKESFSLLSRSEGRTDSRRRHQRGRGHVVVHRRRHQLRDARRADGSVLHLLFDVRSAARRRSCSGSRATSSAKRLFARRDFRSHHAQRRRFATSGRPQPAAREHDSDLPALRSGVRLELAVIVADGLRRMYVEQEDIFYYLAVYNENHPMPAMPPVVKTAS
jgi:pyruvate dehydrogenase E1 component